MNQHRSFLHLRLPLLLALLFAYSSSSLSAATRPIDTERSTFTIHVGKAGLFSAGGHEHTVLAPIAEGTITDSEPGRIAFSVRSSALTVQPEDRQSEIQMHMQQQVLESSRFPDIAFSSNSITRTAAGTWTVTGTLHLHGMQRPVTLNVQLIDGLYKGEVTLKQTDYGIKPYSVGGGAVRVKDELKLNFAIATK